MRSSARLADYTAPDGALSRQLDAVDGQTVTLAVDPMIAASIRVLGSAAPPSAIDWLEQLEANGGDLFALGYADADPVAAIAADGTVAALAPLRIRGGDRSGRVRAGRRFGQRPAAAAGGPGRRHGAADHARTDRLADRRTGGDRSAGARGAGLRARAGGFDRGRCHRGAPPGTDDRRDLRSCSVADTAISAALRAAVAAGPDDAAAALAALRAELAVAGAQPGSTLRVASLDRIVQAPGGRLAAVLSALAVDPTLQLTGLSDALDEPSMPGALIDAPQSEQRRTAVADLLRAERTDALFAQVADEPALLTSRARLDLLALLSGAWGDGAIWQGAVTRSLDRSSDRLDAVGIVESNSSYFQISPQSQLQVPVRNNLDVPITVYASARPMNTVLTVDPAELPVAIQVAPDSTATGLIPVEAVSSGEVVVEIRIADGTGAAVGGPLQVRVNAQPGLGDRRGVRGRRGDAGRLRRRSGARDRAPSPRARGDGDRRMTEPPAPAAAAMPLRRASAALASGTLVSRLLGFVSASILVWTMGPQLDGLRFPG